MAEDRAISLLKERFPTSIAETREFRGEITVVVQRQDIVPICRFLRDEPELAYDFLVDLTAVDLLEHPWKVERFEVVYHLHSYQYNRRIRLAVRVPEHDPVVPSLTSVWPGANWLEREVYDMFGITFAGHPDLRRIIMPADWEGHPMRRDFPVFGTREPVVRVKGFRDNFDQ